MFSVLLILLGFSQSILIVGHRGNGCSQTNCISPYPENTLDSFRQGIRNGAEVVELDVWISKDNVLVLTHRDAQTTNDYLHASIVPEKAGGKTPTVAEYRHSDRSKYKIKMPWIVDKPAGSVWKSDNYTKPYSPATYIPTLEETLLDTCSTGKKIIIEMKGDDARLAPMVFDLVAKLKKESCVHAVSSFFWKKHNHPDYKVVTDLFEPVRADTRLPKALLFNRAPKNTSELIAAAQYYNAKTIHPACALFQPTMQLPADFINQTHKSGLKSMCYFAGGNPDSETAIRAVMKTGLDEVCVNDIVTAKKVAASLSNTPSEFVPV